MESLNRGESYKKRLAAAGISALMNGPNQGRFAATSDMGRFGEPDVLIICIPTPLTAKREPDLRYVENTTRLIAVTLRPGQLISLESTTYPGAMAELLLPILSADLQVGKDFYLVFFSRAGGPGQPTFSSEHFGAGDSLQEGHR